MRMRAATENIGEAIIGMMERKSATVTKINKQ